MNIRQLSMPEVDAQKQDSINEEQARFFLENGFLVARNVLVGEEFKAIEAEMRMLYDEAAFGDKKGHPDFMYGKGSKTGNDIIKRIEYVIDKADSTKALLAHPFILRSVEKLQGSNFIPTWDSMVLKAPNEGAVVPWHRDTEFPDGCNDTRPIFNVDFYLDSADLETCLWVIPGSNLWERKRAAERCTWSGFDTSDAIPVPMNPGDVIFHNILVLHGSPEGDGNPLRRTVYYEFRPAEIEAPYGPHTIEYLPLKQQVLLECIQRRSKTPYGKREIPYIYSPTGAYSLSETVAPSTFRYPHHKFWR